MLFCLSGFYSVNFLVSAALQQNKLCFDSQNLYQTPFSKKKKKLNYVFMFTIFTGPPIFDMVAFSIFNLPLWILSPLFIYLFIYFLPKCAMKKQHFTKKKAWRHWSASPRTDLIDSKHKWPGDDVRQTCAFLFRLLPQEAASVDLFSHCTCWVI